MTWRTFKQLFALDVVLTIAAVILWARGFQITNEYLLGLGGLALNAAIGLDAFLFVTLMRGTVR